MPPPDVYLLSVAYGFIEKCRLVILLHEEDSMMCKGIVAGRIWSAPPTHLAHHVLYAQTHRPH